MKTYKKQFSFTLVILVVTIISQSACKKLIDVGSPKEQTVSGEVFKTDPSATSAVYGIYSSMMSSVLNSTSGGMTIFTGLSSDELTATNGNSEDIDFEKNTISTLSTRNAGLWSSAYMLIYQINSCIEGLDSSPTVTEKVKNQLLGECKLLRAFMYFNLVQLYGNTPLILSTDYTINQSLPRTQKEVVIQQVISDLQSANNLMANTSTLLTGRPNLYSVKAFLAKVYLTQGNWSLAEQFADEVIKSGTYTISGDLNGVFLGDSKEAIWQIIPVNPNQNTTEATNFIPSNSTVIPNYSITQSLLSTFEPNDKRKNAWLGLQEISGVPYYYPFKYKVTFESQKSEYYTIIRLAEIYLIRAESRTQQNKIGLGIEDLDVVRVRAGLIPISDSNPSITKDDLVIKIKHERRIELFCEWGDRWIDLKRTGEINSVLSLHKPNWVPDHALYPIPNAEILLNRALTQNLGYN